MRYRQQLNVTFAFDVAFTRGLFEAGNATLAEALPELPHPSKAAFFIDAGMLERWPGLPEQIKTWCEAHGDRIKLVAPPVTVPGGEAVKNDLTFVQRMSHQFQRLELCRHSFVVAIGGGAVLDAVGLAAAVFHRGIRLIRVPTTVLSQDDSAMGVKNGINLDGVKNLIGTFAPPYAVLCDLNFLATLQQRDWCGGVSEAFKVALIKDAAFLAELEALAPRIAARDLDAMARVVERCAVLHLDHIRTGGDPFESGSARPLDFGHWSAHKLESMTQNAVRHGEAVGIGIALDLFIAARLGLISEAARDRVCAAMETAGLSLWHPALAKPSSVSGLEIVKGLEEFRQHLGGELTLAMPDGLGRKCDIHELDHTHVRDGIAWLAARAGTTLEAAARKLTREAV